MLHDLYTRGPNHNTWQDGFNCNIIQSCHMIADNNLKVNKITLIY